MVAAGNGVRLGLGPKAFVDVGGVPILARALRGVAGMAHPVRVVVVAPGTHLDAARGIAAASAPTLTVDVVPGGATRQQSVAAGLAALTSLAPEVEVVLVHDAARCLTPPGQLDRVAEAVAEHGVSVVPGLRVTDTVKRVADDHVIGTVDRSELMQVQTPQGFPAGVLVGAYAAADREYTDDAAVVQAHGGAVRIVNGDPLAMKITTEWDLRRAEGLTAAASRLRTGVGTDVHGLDPSRPLWLGGLHWPGEPGLAGHSDGDVVCHAVCDALLSAAGLGDIGGRFGVDDERFRDAHGDVFLTATIDLVAGAGFRVANVAVQVIGNRPKLSPRRIELEQRLSGIVGAPVSVSATTADGLGFTGRGEGVAAIATALLQGA